jgi:hypothetical protein
VHFSRSLCMNVAGETWFAAGIGLRLAKCWRVLVDTFGQQSELVARRTRPQLLQSFFECRADSRENQGKRFCPVLVRVAQDGCLQCPVEGLHESVSTGVVGGRPRELNATCMYVCIRGGAQESALAPQTLKIYFASPCD